MEKTSLDISTLFSLTGKIALITGGTSGIGAMMAQGLLQAGATVYITGRNAENCAIAVAELAHYGVCIGVASDVTNADNRRDLVERIGREQGALDILINNAGSAWGEKYETYPEVAFEKLMKINVGGVFALTRDLTPLLTVNATSENFSRVINIGSMDGLHIPTVHGVPSFAYSASKAAVHQLTRALAVELGPKHITVNAVAPGFVPSKMTAGVIAEHGEDMKKNSLLKRLGRAEEMAGIAIYLCSKAGAYTHGTVIPVDGGTSINHQHVIV
ncbi:MAG: NAD(P)-dependent dehydrogenase (short-subunit alcohol dehydrogenase family) [Pseudomonadales bacterium]|jgi:NAD(P)-dependent dehydrogenase (short-subunit alcohol dehydrogenase family)